MTDSEKVSGGWCDNKDQNRKIKKALPERAGGREGGREGREDRTTETEGWWWGLLQ